MIHKKVYAVYATEIGCPEGETPLSWMLLTTEMVEDALIAVELLQVTYLHRTQPEAPAIAILNSVQIEVLKAKASPKLPPLLT